MTVRSREKTSDSYARPWSLQKREEQIYSGKCLGSLVLNIFTVDLAMLCRRGGFITQRHNERFRSRTPEYGLQRCGDWTCPSRYRGRTDARLDIHARGVWENQRSAFLGWEPRAPTDIPQSREREEAPIFEEGFGHWKRNFYTLSFISRQKAVRERSAWNTSRLAQVVSIKKGYDYAKSIS